MEVKVRYTSEGVSQCKSYQSQCAEKLHFGIWFSVKRILVLYMVNLNVCDFGLSYAELVNKKAKIEEQLKEISPTLSVMEVTYR